MVNEGVLEANQLWVEVCRLLIGTLDRSLYLCVSNRHYYKMEIAVPTCFAVWVKCKCYSDLKFTQYIVSNLQMVFFSCSLAFSKWLRGVN